MGDARSRASVGIGGAIISMDFKKPFVGNRLLGTAFLSVGAQPDGRSQPKTGNFAAAGVGVWWTSDPVALGLSVTWSCLHDTAASDRGAYFRQTIAVSPTIAFSVNPDMTLFWGASAEADMTPARCQPPSHASSVRSTLNFGINYAISDNTALNVTVNAGIGGHNTSGLRFALSHRL